MSEIIIKISLTDAQIESLKQGSPITLELNQTPPLFIDREITTTEAMKILDCDLVTMTFLCESGRIPHASPQKKIIRYMLSDILKFKKEGKII